MTSNAKELQQWIESLIDRKIQTAIGQKIDAILEEKINEKLGTLTERINKKVDRAVKTKVKEQESDGGNQLALSGTTQKSLAVMEKSIETKVMKKVCEVIERDIAPQVQSFVDFAQYTMQDGDTLITGFRHHVQEGGKKGDFDIKMLTNPSAQLTISSTPHDPNAMLSKSEFRKKTFAFNDED